MNGRIPTGSKILSSTKPLTPTLTDRLFAGLSKVLAIFEDPIGLDRPLWRDYSYWQGTVNMAVAQANGVYGMVSRAGVGRYYSDSTFAANYANAKTYGLYRSSYFVINPTHSVSSQAALWFSVHPEIDTIPRVIDMESLYGATPAQMSGAVWDMSETVLEHDGVRPIIYSRYLLVNGWLVPYWTDDDLNEHKWWLAQYLIDRMREHPGPPTLPTGVSRTNVIMHQTADKKADFPGECSASATVDYDRWEIGNAEEMKLWINAEWGETVTKIRLLVDRQVYADQSTAAEKVYVAKAGLEMNMEEKLVKANGTIWYRLSYSVLPEPAQWVIGKDGSGTYIEEFTA